MAEQKLGECELNWLKKSAQAEFLETSHSKHCFVEHMSSVNGQI